MTVSHWASVATGSVCLGTERALQMLADAGFGGVRAESVEGDFINT